MDNHKRKDDGSPKVSRLLLVLVATVAMLGVLTYVMAVFFPDFPS